MEKQTFFEDKILNAIHKLTKERIEEIVQEESDRATAKVKQRIAEVVSGVSMQIFGKMEFEFDRQMLMIKIKWEDINEQHGSS